MTDTPKTTEELQRELIERDLEERRRKDAEHIAELRKRAARRTAEIERTYGRPKIRRGTPGRTSEDAGATRKSGGVLFTSGSYRRHWTAKAARAVLFYLRDHHQFVVASTIAVAGVAVAFFAMIN